MIYIFRSKPSNGAVALAQEIDGLKVRGFDRRLPRPGRDVVICWGETSPANLPEGVKVLNGSALSNKFEDAVKLKAAGVPTVEVTRTRPAASAPPAPPTLTLTASTLRTAQEAEAIQRTVGEFLQRIRAFRPGPIVEWLPRKFHHVGGNDLLAPTSSPDYFSKREEIVREFRIHSFLRKSLRAGVKAQDPAEGQQAHPWIRSLNGGWKIKYDGVSSKKAHRELAHKAVEALGLQFGAVDIGEKADGSLIVLEVNRAPGLDGRTIEVYAEAIKGWMQQGA